MKEGINAMIASKFVDCNVLHGYLGNIISDLCGLCDFFIMLETIKICLIQWKA